MTSKMSARAALFLFILLPTAAAAQGSRTLSEQGGNPFTADFPSGGQIRMDLRSAGVTVTGSDENKIQVRVSARGSGDLSSVRISLKTNGNRGELKVTGGPSDNFQIDIQIPRNSDLYARMFAGELDIRGVEGNKDLAVHFGQMDIALAHPDDYAPVRLSVSSGDLEAAAFNVSKGGLFRSFEMDSTLHKSSPGRYSLYAHVGAGEIDIN
ncbi:MAG TPA: hypothetical protein VGR81_01900 [Candidatus Acidoferrales bacterium]|nr:hypothetical protein [Candidatus Acidoferrales bacterium]